MRGIAVLAAVCLFGMLYLLRAAGPGLASGPACDCSAPPRSAYVDFTPTSGRFVRASPDGVPSSSPRSPAPDGLHNRRT